MGILKLFVILALSFLVGFSANAENANQSGGELTFQQETIFAKTLSLERTICETVYPVPMSRLECVNKMATEIDKVFPGALKNAEDLGVVDLLLNLFGLPSDKISTEMMEEWRLSARIIAACSTGNVNECTDKAYRTISSVFDPHTAYMSAEEFADMIQSSTGNISGIGAEVGGKLSKDDPLVVVNPMEGSPAERAGLLTGDLIVGISKDGSESGMRPIESYATGNDAIRDIRGPKGTQVRLLVERQGETQRRLFIITRGVIEIETVKHTLLSEGKKRYGVIAIRNFTGPSCKKTEDAYKKLVSASGGKLDGLVVSVERNWGGYLHEVNCVLDLFADAKSFVLKRSSAGIVPYEPCQKDIFGRKTCQGGTKPHPGDITKGLPILVMINGASASASEVFAAGMKHMGRAIIAGTKTFEKGSAQNIVPLYDRSAVKVTDSEFLIGTLDDWIPVQCLGVTPDIVFDRGLDPKDKNGKPVTDCALNRSIRSNGPIQNAPVHRSFKDANPAQYAAGEAMLEAYKKHAAKEDVKLKKQNELLKRFEKKEEKK